MNFNKKYKINPEYDLLPVSKELFFFSVRDKIYTIKDVKYIALLNAIDGDQSCEEIVVSLQKRFEPSELYYIFYDLEDKGLLLESRPLQKVTTNIFINEDILHKFYTKLATNSLVITVKPLPSLLPHISFDSVPLLILDNGDNQNDKEVIDIIFCTDLLNKEVYDAYQKSIALKHYFFPIQISKSYYWLGPLFTPHQKPCIHCLTSRLRKHRPLYAYIQQKDKRVPVNLLDGTFTKTISIVFNEILPGMPNAKKYLFLYDKTTLKMSRHPVYSRPQCPSCGDCTLFASSGNRPIEIRNAEAKINIRKSISSMNPELTWDKFKHLTDPVTGIISSIYPICENTESLLYVHKAQFTIQPPIDQVYEGVPFFQTCFGKGKTFNQSRTSALCEALERYCSFFLGDEPKIRDSFKNLEPDAILPESLMNYSINQYSNSCYPPNCSTSEKNIRIYHPEESIDWAPAWSLTYNKSRFLPFSFCYGYTPTPPEHLVCLWSSNGNAAGNTLGEAIVNGFLELVERDSVAIWWYNRLSRPGINLDSFNDEYFNKIKEYCLSNSWDMWCLDITTDLTIPSVVALARHKKGKYYFAGFGSHFTMRNAVNKALLELSQVIIPSSRFPFFWNENNIEDTHFLMPSETMYYSGQDRHRQKVNYGIQETITHCIDILKAISLEMIVINLTRPDVGLPVVKVIVPGLRHFWRNSGPGRLYDVPVKLNWITQPNQERDLNPRNLTL